jgi:hypothetical protein
LGINKFILQGMYEEFRGKLSEVDYMGSIEGNVTHSHISVTIGSRTK